MKRLFFALLFLSPLLSSCGRGFLPVWEHVYGPVAPLSAAFVDLRADGRPDLLVGGEGAASAYFDSASGLSQEPDWSWTPPAGDGGNPGICVGLAGRMDSDPYPEIYVSSVAAFGGRGAVYLFRTGPRGPAERPWKVLVGPRNSGGFGERVARAGNLWGDGYDALAVADYTFGGERGIVYVYRGGPDGPGAKPAWSAHGDHPHDWFGYSLCGPGDLDGDGLDDLVIGSKNCDGSCLTWMAGTPGLARHAGRLSPTAWSQAAKLHMAGRFAVYYGSKRGLGSGPGLVMEGESPDEMFAYTLAPAGKPEGGVRAGLLVGSLGWKDRRGRVELLAGGSRGMPMKRLWQTEGTFAGEGLGYALSRVSDLGHGYGPALLVGGMADDDDWAYRPFGPPYTEERMRVLGGEPTHHHLSEIFGSAGDLEGDGVDEVYVLVPGKQAKLEVLKFESY